MAEKMRALQYTTVGKAPEIVELDRPEPGPGQVLLKITAAGVCHSDEFVMSLPEDVFTPMGWRTPMTLGHEGAGTVAELGQGVTEFAVGDSVAVYGPWGCGVCDYCVVGKEMLCPHAAAMGSQAPGLGAPGAMADYMIVDTARHLVPLGDLDPVASVSLTDAGLTPYHAIKRSLHKLTPGKVAVCIGAGGLGHMAIQILRAISPVTVVALDVSEQKLELAREVGAHHTFMSDASAVEKVRALTNGVGVAAVFDFVGNDVTAGMAGQMVAPEAEISIVGVGGGSLPVGFGIGPWDVAVRSPYWGSRPELIEVFELARSGKISVEHEVFALTDGPKAYERLHEGTLRGRAVLVP
jgi:propanol-preferring alcohol dehydrogenase